MKATLAVTALCLLASTVAAAAPDYPARKPGLWEITIQSDSGAAKAPAQLTQQCMDAASDKALRDMGEGMGKNTCSRQDMRKDGATLVVDSVCRIGSTTATTHAVMSGDFSTAYRMESRSTYSPPLMGRAEGTAVIEARWVGPCKPGQKPGDMVMSNGLKMNLLEMAGGKK